MEKRKKIYVNESYAGRSCIITLSLTTNCSAINTTIERKKCRKQLQNT